MTEQTEQNRADAMSRATHLKELASLISSSDKKVIFMLGAGTSTSCGIPDFRSPGTGLYHNLQKLNLPFAEAVFDIDYFTKTNPKPFYILASEMYPGQFLPSRFHFMIRLFQEKGILHRVYTQNIDTLERVAGVEDKYIVEAHGSYAKNYCVKCHEEYPGDLFKEQIFKDEVPECLKCKGLVKPDIVFFGEGLPEIFFDRWEEDGSLLDVADAGEFVTITAGTSLTVYPFASLPSEVPKKHIRALVNLDIVGDFKENARKSDLIFQQSTDEFANDLVELLGWTKEFEELIEETKKQIGQDTVTNETTEEKVDDVVRDIGKELEAEQKEKLGDKEQSIDDLSKNLETLGLGQKDAESDGKSENTTSNLNEKSS